MNKFIGRKQELNALNEAYNTRDAMVLINGRRHTGKTALAHQFARGKPTLFYSAREVTDHLNRKSFYSQIEQSLPDAKFDMDNIPDWGELFRLYSTIPAEGRKILVLDDLGYIIQNDAGFLKTLAHAWDKNLRPNNVLLICIMANNSVLTNIETTRNPFMNAVSLRIKLQPVSFIEMLRDYPHHSYGELVSLYSLAGGFPMYWDFFEGAYSIMDQLSCTTRHMLKPAGWFYEMPLSLIERDVWEPIFYTSILSYMAEGATTIKELADVSGFKPKEVEQYLTNLELLGYVRPEVSVLDRRFKTKNARYYFADPVFHFWFKYVFPNKHLLERGHEDLVLEMIKQDFPNFIQTTFRDVSQEVFLAGLMQNSMDFNADLIGRYWNEDVEIPIMAVDKRNKQIFFADTMYAANQYSLEKFRDFVNSLKNVKELKKYRDYKKIYGLFTATKPSKELIQYCMQDPNVIIFSGTTQFRKQT